MISTIMPVSTPLSIDSKISRDEPLQLPWEWLAKALQFAPAAGVRAHLNATTPQHLR